jgi:hypothetical protein
MLSKNPKGLDGSIKAAAVDAPIAFRFHIVRFGRRATAQHRSLIQRRVYTEVRGNDLERKRLDSRMCAEVSDALRHNLR